MENINLGEGKSSNLIEQTYWQWAVFNLLKRTKARFEKAAFVLCLKIVN